MRCRSTACRTRSCRASGVHLIQVLERRQVALDIKQQREQARNVLREQRFEEAYAEWIRDLRGRAYVEMREPPV